MFENKIVDCKTAYLRNMIKGKSHVLHLELTEVSAYPVQSCRHAHPFLLILYSVVVYRIDLGANELLEIQDSWQPRGQTRDNRKGNMAVVMKLQRTKHRTYINF